MNATAFKMDKAGLNAAEQFWKAQHDAGLDYKFAVTHNGELVAIGPESEFYNTSFAYKTPREAEQATVNKQPTRSPVGSLIGSIIAPRSQYHVADKTGRAADPVRAEQSSLMSDVGRDALGNVAHYGPGVAALLPTVRRLPYKVLGPGAAAISLAGDVANAGLDEQADDDLYSSTPENMLLTAGAAGTGAMLQKYFSKPEQIKRELDDLIRAKMGLGSRGKVDKRVRKEIYERGTKGLPMYTWDDWHEAPIRDFYARYGSPLPMVYKPQPLLRSGKGAQILSRDAKPSAITKDIVLEWLARKGVNPQSVNINEVQRILQNTYPRSSVSNLGMAMFPTKDTPRMTTDDWARHKHEAASQEEGALWDESAALEDEKLDKEWQRARKARGERRKKTDILNKSEANRGKGGSSALPIITQEQFDKLGKTGKYRRGLGRAAGFLLPIGAEVFGRTVLSKEQ
jgi:hypothetical protein